MLDVIGVSCLQLETRASETVQLQLQVSRLSGRLKELEHLKDLESTVHSQKWEEFSRLAESMKNLSHSMASRSQSPQMTKTLDIS